MAAQFDRKDGFIIERTDRSGGKMIIFDFAWFKKIYLHKKKENQFTRNVQSDNLA